jgi:hypothetical protein
MVCSFFTRTREQSLSRYLAPFFTILVSDMPIAYVLVTGSVATQLAHGQTGKAKKVWPWVFLPSQAPGACITMYGYISSVAFSKSKITIQDIVSDPPTWLQGERDSEQVNQGYLFDTWHSRLIKYCLEQTPTHHLYQPLVKKNYYQTNSPFVVFVAVGPRQLPWLTKSLLTLANPVI